ncbi:MAG TPA: TetR/AcrR family transcriptional regulator [Vicinamibacterales bacterium]|nr:TetR/AcrR family transcriptional regulator [Vicinamibacterales bacterium]
MGIKERHERDREAVRRAILDAARELFVTEGFQHVSIRKIAERIEYSPAAIYSYFPSKDDIFFALAEEGFRLLGSPAIALDRLQDLPPLERLRSIFWRMYEFSVEHPQYFALMFVERSVPRISREYERFAFMRTRKQEIIGVVEACIASGDLPDGTNPGVAFRVLTAGLLGIATLRLSERLAPGENADDLARDVLAVAIAGLRAGVQFTSVSAGPCPGDEPATAVHAAQTLTSAVQES